MRLIDAHCHLQDKRLFQNVDKIILAATAKGIKKFVVCGTSPKDWEAVLQLAKRFESVIPFFGVHPWQANDLEADWYGQLKYYLDQCPSGIGEAGLDHADANQDFKKQESVFIQQLQLAQQRSVPIQIHCRRAWDRMPELLHQHTVDAGIILHSFSGSQELVHQLSGLNVYFSFSGSITRSGNKRAHRSLQAVPLERVLLETDAPDMPVVIDHQLKYDCPNVPENLITVLQQAAALRKIAAPVLGEQIWGNARSVFRTIKEFE